MSLEPSYSHIYVETGAEDYPFARSLLEKFPRARIINVRDYKEVFNRPDQDFGLQKQSPKLILAVKKDQFLYDGSRFVQDSNNQNFFYNALSLNCPYDCAYCYLQGMYNSANQVCFVNLEDFFSAAEQAIQNRRDPSHPLYLCISYDTDLLGFESIAPYCREWIEFCRGRASELLIEIRTKSANFSALADLPAEPNVILAWSLSPEEVCQRYERKTPSLKSRLKAMAQAAQAGWQVRLCIDPILPIENWEACYRELVDNIFMEIKTEALLDAHLGVFRMSTDFFSNARKRRPTEAMFYRPWKREKGTITHPANEREALTDYVRTLLAKRLPPEKIRIW